VLVSEDTDFIVLLCYHAGLDSHDLFFCPEPKKSKKNFKYEHQIHKRKLGQNICDNILFVLFLGVIQHPISMGLERGHLLASSVFREQAKVFHFVTQYVIDAGDKALVLV